MDKIRKFMYGRYGIIDELYKFLFYEVLILLIINLFWKNMVIDILSISIFIYMIYRLLSKKIYKRALENKRFLKIRDKLFNRNKDKNHIYRKCSKCKKVLRLPIPNERGFKKVKCPNCGKKMKIFTFKKVKIEVIKGGKR